MKQHFLLRPVACAVAAGLFAALSGCGSLTGLNAGDDFSCPMTPGVSCRSLSDTYEDSVRGRTPDRLERDKAIEAASKALPEIADEPSDKQDAAQAAPADKASAVKAAVQKAGDNPKRLPEVIVTIWIAPWTDDEGDFHEGERIHARAFDARWAAARRRAEAAEARAVVQLPFANRTPPAAPAMPAMPKNAVTPPVADTGISPFGEGSRRFIEAQKAALKGTPYDPEPLAGETMAEREVR